MVFDYLHLELPVSKKTGLHSLTLQMKMNKVLFMLHLYPDFELAGAFAGVGNIHNFIPYHYGKEIYNQMKEDVSNRRVEKKSESLLALMEDVYNLWFEDYDINNLYNMITGKCIVEQEIVKEKEEIQQTFYRENELKASENLTFSSVIEQMDVFIELERGVSNPNIAPGKWWVIYYDNMEIKGKFVPFILMGRINDDGKIAYIQGAWPLEYLMKALSRILRPGYKAKKNKKQIYLEIEAELRPVSVGGGVYHHYTSIREIKSPIKEDGLW